MLPTLCKRYFLSGFLCEINLFFCFILFFNSQLIAVCASLFSDSHRQRLNVERAKNNHIKEWLSNLLHTCMHNWASNYRNYYGCVTNVTATGSATVELWLECQWQHTLNVPVDVHMRADLIYSRCPTSTAIRIIKIRRSWCRLIFIMGISVLVRSLYVG